VDINGGWSDSENLIADGLMDLEEALRPNHDNDNSSSILSYTFTWYKIIVTPFPVDFPLRT